MAGSNRKTIESEVMDHQFAHEGNAADLGWSAHDHEQYRPDKVRRWGEAGMLDRVTGTSRVLFTADSVREKMRGER